MKKLIRGLTIRGLTIRGLISAALFVSVNCLAGTANAMETTKKVEEIKNVINEAENRETILFESADERELAMTSLDKIAKMAEYAIKVINEKPAIQDKNIPKEYEQEIECRQKRGYKVVPSKSPEELLNFINEKIDACLRSFKNQSYKADRLGSVDVQKIRITLPRKVWYKYLQIAY
ncbi:MAG: hypothetical protein LBG13_02560 [Holosporales bacterium]|jgi:hypothetical protein|nr:hypothetical protein [Holosporales bacterium]